MKERSQRNLKPTDTSATLHSEASTALSGKQTNQHKPCYSTGYQEVIYKKINRVRNIY